MGQEIDDVKKLQLLLKKYGRYKGKIDGWYGPKLAAAVQEFQKDNALKTDSVFGPKTRAALMAPRLDDKGDDYEDSPCPYAPDGPAVKYYVGRSPGYMPRKEVVEEITSALKQWSDSSGVNEFLFDGKGGELARAGMNEETKISFIQFDMAEKWYVQSQKSKKEPGDYGLLPVVLHESGHVLGLGHSKNPNFVMF